MPQLLASFCISTLMDDLKSSVSPYFSFPKSSNAPIKQTRALALPAQALVATATLATMAVLAKKYSVSTVVGGIYDKIIVKMTETWYRSVLEKQKDGAIILDVGIGTGSALLRCKDIIKAKKLKIIGVDYNNFYVEAAAASVKNEEMTGSISVHALNIYDEEALRKILTDQVDSVYFSGSFSLLPNPKAALISVLKVLKPNGKIYITQTYQKKTPPLMTYVKPLLKFVTTIDFGKLVTVTEIVKTLNNVEGLKVEDHSVIDGSLDNYWQAAYLSILVPDGIKKAGWEKWF